MRVFIAILVMLSIVQYSTADSSMVKSNPEADYNNNLKSSHENKSTLNFQLSKRDYERAYDDFYMKLIDKKKGMKNFDEFINNLEESDRLWRKYIISECSAEASLNEMYSKEYLSVYELCMAQHYNKKSAYYMNFKLK
ncbi:lysozyme inhibitor LprI family protein [Erwinia phyllosphaerae]|uniref:lysozyme inhibitor LprI family protein n=1 Tax=Erwinia phyllosphaerae TaxID=2853256 RepID=UPI001FEE3E61|nr:lysozyme inhibitor LprI family protein [Erwinia phyllosphaerae]MBV4368384.1 DUF1311 domain-containing protein [Erwinia phyllosphaerae]